ncbi:MAG: hypothetical protein E6R03_04720 [Hyphomicrobiaceae bacterium]|nr:MAG: hypothetical protein E6R03_04720 [Hyphomicrobiaceae bacterium]
MNVGNSSGVDTSVGIAIKMADSDFKAGQWDDSETASYIDDTTDAQDAGTNDFALTTTTNNDGFVIQCKDKFNLVGLTISQAAEGSPVFLYEYFNGTSFVTLSQVLDTPVLTGLGDTYLTFLTPSDFAPIPAGNSLATTDGLTVGYYAIRMKATTAPSTAALASVIWTAAVDDYLEKLSDGSVSILEEPDILRVLPGRSIMPYFADADEGNYAIVKYSLKSS